LRRSFPTLAGTSKSNVKDNAITRSWLSLDSALYRGPGRCNLELGFRGMARRSHRGSNHKYRLVQVSFNVRAWLLLPVLITITARHLQAGQCSGTLLGQ
jgi:hypothetical protein